MEARRAAPLTGRSDAVLSRNLMLWFNALYEREVTGEIHCRDPRKGQRVQSGVITHQRSTKGEQAGERTGVLRRFVTKTKYPQRTMT